MTMKLWHCHNARSLRPLWALEEMGMDYELVELPFPPRIFQKDYLKVNPLGTVPYFVDGDTHMTESSAIGHYLVERYQRYDFGLKADHAEFGDYLNWMYHSDATLTFPQTIAIRYAIMEPEERRLPQAVRDYSRWFLGRLKRLERHIAGRKYLCDSRFTVADIAIGYALYLGEILGFSRDYSAATQSYLDRLKARPAFRKVVVIGEEKSNFKDVSLPLS